MDVPARRRAGSLHQKGSQPGSAQDRCMVTCRLQRNTFLPGEQVRGTVKFGVSSEDQEKVDILEATVQAHGYVKVDPRWIALPTSLRNLFRQEAAPGEGKTSEDVGIPIPRYSGLTDDKSACVFASEVAVLLKEDSVERGDPASFRFSLVLPDKLTPTFRGVGVRYAYAVTVRVRRTLPPPPAAGRLLGLVRRRPAAGSWASPGFSTTDVHVAFTVLSEGSDVMVAAGGGTTGGVARFLTNSFGDDVGVDARGVFNKGWGGSGSGWGRVAFAELETERQSRNTFELEAERAKAGGLVSGTRAVTWNMQGRVLDDGYGKPGFLPGEGDTGDGEPPPPPLVYSIRSGDHRIGSFILHKAEFCAGDIVLGNFDFSGASTRCLQVCACLEVCEENQNAFSADAATSAPGQGEASAGGKSTCHKRVVDSCKELTPCLVQSSVTLSLPMDAPVTFSTELVSISWSLRFEFVMSPPESRWSLGGFAPSKASVLKWAVPFRVVPPRRAALAAGGCAGDENGDIGFSSMDATGRTVVC
ncbi:unnamed protein product [Pylaiella littoralis]